MKKEKKPFYKRVWFIVLVIIVILVLLLSREEEKGEQFAWSTDIELCDMLPKPKSDMGDIITNDKESLWLNVYKTSKEDYTNYVEACDNMGYNTENTGLQRQGINKDGYELTLDYDAKDKQMTIQLDAPMEMGTLKWPTNEIASLLPVPESQVGNVARDSSENLLIYVGKTSLEEYNDYIEKCISKGFNIDYNKQEEYFSANHVAGYHISVKYEKTDIMAIDVSKTKSESVSNSNSSTTNTTNDSKEIRTEFKEAMDSYEAFYDEYCEFMKKYMENPTDTTLLNKYTSMLQKAVDMDETFKAWESKDMNEAELKYYLEVTNRISQKLLEVAM